jgi:UDPglucose 6-dehydrogenase
MNIGIIGLGVVGSAVKQGLEGLGHSVPVFDLRLPGTKFEDVLDSALSFICVSSPQLADGSCDTRGVEETVGKFAAAKYRGVVVIKSTVTPGTTDRLIERFPGLTLAFCPEFLRERCALDDFTGHHDVCVIGTRDEAAYRLVKEAHGRYPKAFFMMKPVEAELSKYFSNVFNALRVTFANEFYEVCGALRADYATIKEAMVARESIDDHYLDCSPEYRGFGGPCLPKDTAAFAALVDRLGLDMRLFRTIVEENKKFDMTVPKGMRPS